MYVCVTSFLDHVALSLRLLGKDCILAVSVRVVELAHIWFAPAVARPILGTGTSTFVLKLSPYPTSDIQETLDDIVKSIFP